MAVDKEKIEKLEKNVNKWIIRIIIGGVLIFEKFPDVVERLKKWGKEVYIHLMEEYRKFKDELKITEDEKDNGR